MLPIVQRTAELRANIVADVWPKWHEATDRIELLESRVKYCLYSVLIGPLAIKYAP